MNWPVPIARAGAASPLRWSAAGVVAAVAVGIGAAFRGDVAVALVAGLALAGALALRPRLILAALVASVYLEILSVGGVTVSRLLAPVALLVVLAVVAREHVQLRAAPPLVWAAAYGLWALASGLWSVDLERTAFQIGSLAVAVAYMLAFAALLDSRRELLRVGHTFAFSALGLGLFAIFAIAVGLPGQLEAGRTAGGTGDPNFFAAYQLVALPLALALAVHASARWLRIALYAAAAVAIASVFTSASRGGLLALLGVIFLTALLPWRAIFRSQAQKALVLLAVLVGVGLAFSTASGLASRFQLLAEGTDVSGSGRVDLWRGAWTSIKERPLLGLGYGAFPSRANELLLQTPGIDVTRYELKPEGAEAHSAYVSTAADLGLPGLALFLGLVIATGRQLRRAAVRARLAGDGFVARMANALLLGLAAWSVSSLLLSTQTSRGLWLLTGISLALPRVIEDRIRRRSA